MKLKKLLKQIPEIEIRGSKDIEITGISNHSKTVSPGNLFIAKKGGSVDGRQFIPEAVKAGASSILSDSFNPFLKVTQLIHPQVNSIEPEIASLYYDYPSHHLMMVGITGTNGKTTTSFLVKHFLDQLEVPCGLIGSIEHQVGGLYYVPTHTTPDVITNHKFLKEMLNKGCRACVMEVSSHALDQERVKNIEYDLAIYTNLSPEHLDYHKTMPAYAKAKALLFQNLEVSQKKSKMATFNLDCPWHESVIGDCKEKLFSYSLIDKNADLFAGNIQLSDRGSSFHLHHKNESFPIFFPLIGRFNIYNLLAAISAPLALGYSLDKIIPLIASSPRVPGRLEKVPHGKNFSVYVDHAHKEGALEQVLGTLKEFVKGKIITVFGCGGNRDRLKRPKMATISEKYSDWTIVTNDNPRNEDPQEIIQEIIQGFSTKSWNVEPDREKAIEMAISIAKPEDFILIAGKGHEKMQIFKHKTIPFDDIKVANKYLSKL